ncbi:MAG: hypothetical protein ACTSVY_16690 [Candidatus Helarchaeota archaeon]
MIKITNVPKSSSKNKLKIDIYVPLSACACMYENFMNQVFSVLMEYIDDIDFNTKDLNSAEAQELHLTQNSVVINGNKIITSSFKLKRELPKLLNERNS